IGLGESYNGYRCAELHPPAVAYFAPILMGRNVEDVPQLWQWMYQCEQFWCRSGFGLGVINGIEAALWDLKGQAENKPVYELLGGLQHETLPAYASGGPSNYPKQRLAAKIDHYLALGFRGFKLGTGQALLDRKSTRLNSSHRTISYAVFCLKKKKKKYNISSCHYRTHAH